MWRWVPEGVETYSRESNHASAKKKKKKDLFTIV